MRLIVVEFMTLDGVMEAPGFEEHRAGRNAWAMRVSDERLQAFNRDQVFEADALLFGRTTYSIWAAFWPTGPDTGGMTERINAMPKYVVSKTLGKVDWSGTTVLRGDLEEEIRAVKDAGVGNLVVYGSADLVAGLLALDLVDELRIVLFPVLLGSGKRLFRDEADLRQLRLVRSQAFDSGVVQLSYVRELEPLPEEDLGDFRWTEEHARSFQALKDTDRVLATVVFTDVVDSTRRAAELGDRAWRLLIDRHDEVARAEVERWQGRLVKSTGDGVLAQFDSPTRAVRCALGLEAALAKLGLEIRAAVHTGEIEVRRDDVGGIGVHIASRVLPNAGPGEVVVTRTVRDLATGAGLAFRPLGTVELRGVPEAWELFAASAS